MFKRPHALDLQEAAGVFDYLHANVPLRLDFVGLLDLAPDATSAAAAICLAQVTDDVHDGRIVGLAVNAHGLHWGADLTSENPSACCHVLCRPRRLST